MIYISKRTDNHTEISLTVLLVGLCYRGPKVGPKLAKRPKLYKLTLRCCKV